MPEERKCPDCAHHFQDRECPPACPECRAPFVYVCPECCRLMQEPDKTMCPMGHQTDPPPAPSIECHCHCPHCGFGLSAMVPHCPNCQNGLNYHCPGCGVQVPPDATECPFGHKFHCICPQ
jgi:hypothetical protein